MSNETSKLITKLSSGNNVIFYLQYYKYRVEFNCWSKLSFILDVI